MVDVARGVKPECKEKLYKPFYVDHDEGGEYIVFYEKPHQTTEGEDERKTSLVKVYEQDLEGSPVRATFNRLKEIVRMPEAGRRDQQAKIDSSITLTPKRERQRSDSVTHASSSVRR